MMLKLVALALVLSVVSGAPGGGFLDAHVDDEYVDDVDDGSVEEQATNLLSLLQVENGDRQAALRGGLNLKRGGDGNFHPKGGRTTTVAPTTSKPTPTMDGVGPIKPKPAPIAPAVPVVKNAATKAEKKAAKAREAKRAKKKSERKAERKAKKAADDCLVKAGGDVAKEAACATDEEDSVTEEATKAAKAVRK